MIFYWKISWGWKRNLSYECLAHIFNHLQQLPLLEAFNPKYARSFKSNTPSMIRTAITLIYGLGFWLWPYWTNLNNLKTHHLVLAKTFQKEQSTVTIRSTRENRVNSWPHYNQEEPIDVYYELEQICIIINSHDGLLINTPVHVSNKK